MTVTLKPSTLPKIVAIHVGLPREVEIADVESLDAFPRDRFTTAFWKKPIVGDRVHVRRLGLDGDGQADLVNHGGPDKAVCCYSADHYPSWRNEFGANAFEEPFGPPAFGENLTIAGLDESTVCIGDRFAAGDVVFEVSQPRQPCWKLARRWKLDDLPARVIATGRTGWYLRVIVEGELLADSSLMLVDRPFARWTLALANTFMYDKTSDLAATRELSMCPALSASWQMSLAKRARARADS